jgi:intein/homing endonuclease
MEMQPSQQFVYMRTYARWLPEENRRELSWGESVDRYLGYMKSKYEDKVPVKVWKKAEKNLKELGAVGSMRATWTAGPALDTNHISAYNCAYLAYTDLRAVAEHLFVLMHGTGVGFSTEHEYISQMPSVPFQTSEGAGVYTVDDSKEGWAEALLAGLNAWFAGKDIEFDYSQIRPRGARLKKFGGRASGPDPLRKLLDFTRDVVLKAQGRQLTSIEWLDIGNMLGEVVVVGGVRRSAEINFSDLDDEAIRNAKNYPFPVHRYMSNNSAVYKEKPSVVEFMKEWTALAASGSGERGIFNVYAVEKHLSKHGKRREFKNGLRTNPCFVAGTMVQTKDGSFPIESLVGKKVTIYDGNQWVEVDNFRVTGEDQEVLRITMHDGSYEEMTPYHTVILENGERIKAKDVVPGMRLKIADAPVVTGGVRAAGAYLKGFLIGDGTHMEDRPVLFLYDTKYSCEERLAQSAAELTYTDVYGNSIEEISFKESTYNRKFMKGLSVRKDKLIEWATTAKVNLPQEVFTWDKSSKLEFIAGLFDSDGSAQDSKNGFNYQISSIQKGFLLDLQKLLKTVGVQSHLGVMKKAGVVDFNDGYGEYETKQSYRLTLSQRSAIALSRQVSFSRLISFADKSVAYSVKNKWNVVSSVETAGIARNVYCCTVPVTHSFALSNGILYGNCGEILLRPREFCNLTEVIVRPEDSFDDLIDKVEVAVWLGTMQAGLTDFKWLSPEWRKNCEEEALLGVSLTGQMDNVKLMTEEKLEILKAYAIKTNKKASKALGINVSAAITTGKPSGTVSQLALCGSGAHPWYDPHYIRRYRISATDPIFRMMRDQGFKFVPENGQGPNPKLLEEKRTTLREEGWSESQILSLAPDWDESQVNTWVVEFPTKAPEGAVTRHDMGCIEQLEWYLKMVRHWCEHNQSITVYVKDDEWLKVGAWVYDHFEELVGVSFLPHSGGIYSLAPYETITKEQYEEMVTKLPTVDWSKLPQYELDDTTEGAKTLACAGNACELN